MNANIITCSRCVDLMGNCHSCSGKMVKHGFSLNGKRRYKCSNCNKTRVSFFSYNAYLKNINKQIVQLTIEGLGIRSTARVLGISNTTLLKRIIEIAAKIVQPIISKGKVYEVDEMRTYIKRKDKLIWIISAYERESKRVISFYIGSRTNKTINLVLKTLQFAKAKKIFTDRLKNYKYLIDKKTHNTVQYGTNHVERMHLSMRTHLKRLNRRTICFSRNLTVLNSILKIYFWGNFDARNLTNDN